MIVVIGLISVDCKVSRWTVWRLNLNVGGRYKKGSSQPWCLNSPRFHRDVTRRTDPSCHDWLWLPERRVEASLILLSTVNSELHAQPMPLDYSEELGGRRKPKDTKKILASRYTDCWWLTLVLSAELAPCTQIAGLTLQPKLVDTHRMFSPNAWKSLQNCCVNWTLGLSSATTTHVRTHAKLMFRDFKVWIELLNALVQSSIMPYEQKVSRTRYCDRVESQSEGFASTCDESWVTFDYHTLEEYAYFIWRNENWMMSTIHADQSPHTKSKPAVRIQAEGHVSRWV